MRLVFDTNVLIAALIARRKCSDLLEHCVLRHTLVTSDAIMRELHDQLVGKFNYTVQDCDEAVSLLRSQMESVIPTTLDGPVCRDPDDDHILATAIAGRTQCIVTGDKDLLILHDTLELRSLTRAISRILKPSCTSVWQPAHPCQHC